MLVDVTAISLSIFPAAIRGWLSAGRVKREACRDGDFGHSSPTKGTRESGGRQPSKDAH